MGGRAAQRQGPACAPNTSCFAFLPPYSKGRVLCQLGRVPSRNSEGISGPKDTRTPEKVLRQPESLFTPRSPCEKQAG